MSHRPTDVVVTTPLAYREAARREAEVSIAQGGGYYVRKIPFLPIGCRAGSRCFYVEAGYVRGYAVVEEIRQGRFVCDVTGRDWGHGTFLVMRADSWRWIEPIPMRGFQGIRPFTQPFTEVGGWLDPMPATPTSLEEPSMF